MIHTEPVDSKTGFIKANWLVGVLIALVCILGTVVYNRRKESDHHFEQRVTELEKWRMQAAVNHTAANEILSIKKDIERLEEQIHELKAKR